MSERSAPVFSVEFRDGLQALFEWRRDVRRFKTDSLPSGAVERLVETACLAPSVGLSQPWRFVLVEDPARRRAIFETFCRCNADALSAYEGEHRNTYARLKLAGLKEAPCQLAVFTDEGTTQGHGLGQRTMPLSLHYSVAGAITYLWLAARAEGIGLGWVSILDPEEVREALDVPSTWSLAGYLCLGYPERDSNEPELQREGWEERRPPQTHLLRR